MSDLQSQEHRISALEEAVAQLAPQVDAQRRELAALRNPVGRFAKQAGASGEILDGLGVPQRPLHWDQREGGARV